MLNILVLFKGTWGVVKTDNTVHCGDNYFRTDKLLHQHVQLSLLASPTAVKQISGNGQHIMLVLDNGSTSSFGYNYGGTMAHGSGNSPQNNYNLSGSIYLDGTKSMDNISYIVGVILIQWVFWTMEVWLVWW